MTKREGRLLRDQAYAAYMRLNGATYASGQERRELLEEHETFTRYVLKALKQDE